MTDDLMAPEPGPSRDTLAEWRAAARTGNGTPWLPPAHAEALARYALKFNEGVHMMEAIAPRFREPVRETAWEILGADSDGWNWTDHQNPQLAFALMEEKLRWARKDGARLKYRLWLRDAGT